MQILGYTGNDDARKFFLSGEVTVQNIKVCPYALICFSRAALNFFFWPSCLEKRCSCIEQLCFIYLYLGFWGRLSGRQA